jgi:hypothetical protein
MSVVIQESTATMTAEYGGARPAVTYANQGGVDMAVLHQTRNSGPVVAGRFSSRAEIAAIKITASVDVAAPSASDIERRYAFHILQLAWKPADYALYAGPSRADGCMKLDFVAPPFYPGGGAPLLLDADETGARPYPYAETAAARIRRAGNPGLWTASVELVDHPFVNRPLRLPNFATASSQSAAKSNYLFEVCRSLYFFTAFIVQDLDSGDRKTLGVLNWKSALLARIRWRASLDPLPAVLVRAVFTSEGYFAGAPSENIRKAIADPPSDPSDAFNAMESANYRNVVGARSNSPAFQASGTWAPFVPTDLVVP